MNKFFKKKIKPCLSLGRSMIEMLGVLAIIGVLSIGGLYAYRQAMLRYKVNRWLDFLSRVQMTTIDACSSRADCAFQEGKEGQDFFCFRAGTPEECNKYYQLTSVDNLAWQLLRNKNYVYLVLPEVPKDLCVAMVSRSYPNISLIHAFYEDFPTRPFLKPTNKTHLLKDCQAREKGKMIFFWTYTPPS